MGSAPRLYESFKILNETPYKNFQWLRLSFFWPITKFENDKNDEISEKS